MEDNVMPISRDQIEALSKQVFIVEYLLNGMFPCQSDVVRLIRSKKREWKFSDKFEYRMLLAGTNTGGSLNSQTFRENVGMIKKGDLEYGTFRATYGTVSDGFDVDMTLNLETNDKKVAFENDFATRMHALRMNVASLFKNFAIHGQFGVLHQLSAPYQDGSTWVYECYVADGFAGSYIPAEYLLPGRQVSRVGSAYEEYSDEADIINYQTPFKMRNHLQTLRLTYDITGDAYSTVLAIALKDPETGKSSYLWADYQYWKALREWKKREETALLFSKSNRNADGTYGLKGTNGRPKLLEIIILF